MLRPVVTCPAIREALICAASLCGAKRCQNLRIGSFKGRLIRPTIRAPIRVIYWGTLPPVTVGFRGPSERTEIDTPNNKTHNELS